MKRRYPQLSDHDTAHAHRGIAPKFPTLSADRPQTCPEDLWIWYPFFHIFLFSIPVTRYAPGGEKDTLFTRFNLRWWCTGPNEICPICLGKWKLPEGKQRSILLAHVGKWHCTHFEINNCRQADFVVGQEFVEFTCPTGQEGCLLWVTVIQWNLFIMRSDITKSSYNEVILLVPGLYISLSFYPDIMRNLI